VCTEHTNTQLVRKDRYLDSNTECGLCLLPPNYRV